MHYNHNNVIDLTTRLLEDVVRACPAIDVHTHIRPESPSAGDLGDILFYHYIVAELAAAGVSREKLQRAAPIDEKIALFSVEHHHVSNTVTFWCLRRVLEAFGVDAGAELTVNLLSDLNQKVQDASADSDWPRELLLRQNKIHRTFLTLNITEALPTFDRELFSGAMRLDDIVAGLSPATLEQMAEVTGANISSLEHLERTAGESLSAFAASGGLAVTAGMPPEEDFVRVSRAAADKLFARILRGETLASGEQTALHSYALQILVDLARNLHLPVQLLLGVRRPLPGGTAIPVLRPDLAVRFTPLFNSYPDVSFDLMLSPAAHSQELIAIAKSYPNVSLAGFWWYAFSPPYIRAMLTERLLALPAVKLHGFFSDAYNIEWSVGKLALVRSELARVLAELIVSGYLSESQAPEIAGALLYDNPARFYGIHQVEALELETSPRRSRY